MSHLKRFRLWVTQLNLFSDASGESSDILERQRASTHVFVILFAGKNSEIYSVFLRILTSVVEINWFNFENRCYLSIILMFSFLCNTNHIEHNHISSSNNDCHTSLIRKIQHIVWRIPEQFGVHMFTNRNPSQCNIISITKSAFSVLEWFCHRWLDLGAIFLIRSRTSRGLVAHRCTTISVIEQPLQANEVHSWWNGLSTESTENHHF